MDDQDKKAYLEQYQEAKKKGVPFFPNTLFKDAVVSLLVFLLLIALAYFLGAPLEERANPADTTYTPRPEWYFLFLFQLLKYFPGKLEVVGVVVVPTVALIILFLLPVIDRNNKRYFMSRMAINGITLLAVVGIAFLTVQALMEAPPPIEAKVGDPTAQLYLKNCAGCHGASIKVAPGTNLHNIIAQGYHEDMPAWSADLTTDEIDALAGFILSPKGSQVFSQNCGECHENPADVSEDPLKLKEAISQGSAFAPHADLDIPKYAEALSQQDITAMVNFLVAPDGQRLFVTNCSPCHGRAVAYTGNIQELELVISEGGKHLDMPSWKGTLNSAQIETLARYVVSPPDEPDGTSLFKQYCQGCHGERVPSQEDVEQAKLIITTGGSHQTMPVWGDILTAEQLDALVNYTVEASSGAPLELGQQLFSSNCATCHGEFGEGGINPANPADIIAPISTSEYLKTRDDLTLRSIISQGQPNLGMSPFSSSFGGPLDDEEVDAIVMYLRSWEAKPPVELPPEVAAQQVAMSGQEIFANLCTQCHGQNGEGGIGPALSDPKFQDANTDQEIFDVMNKGHKATSMIAWGEILSAQQIEELVKVIRQMRKEPGETPGPTSTMGVTSFANDILPIFQAKCTMCHGTMGGWNATTYDSVINSGDHGPSVIAGDAQNSLLAQKILGTHTFGTIMPPGGRLSDAEIALILAWINAGAPNN